MLDDGVYDVLVVDATEAGPGLGGEPPGDALHLDLTILAGPHKGEVVAVRAVGLGRDPLDLLAEPGVLEVEGGQPRFTLD